MIKILHFFNLKEFFGNKKELGVGCSCSTYFWLHLCSVNLRSFWPFRIRRLESNQAATDRHCVMSRSTGPVNVPNTTIPIAYITKDLGL